MSKIILRTILIECDNTTQITWKIWTFDIAFCKHSVKAKQWNLLVYQSWELNLGALGGKHRAAHTHVTKTMAGPEIGWSGVVWSNDLFCREEPCHDAWSCRLSYLWILWRLLGILVKGCRMCWKHEKGASKQDSCTIKYVNSTEAKVNISRS